MARTKRKPRPAIEPGETPTPEQLAQGGYERGFVTHVETATKAMAHISAHSPVARWNKARRLSDSQNTAIALCGVLWAICGLKQKLCASYGERMPVSCDNEWLANERIDAAKRLRRIEGYVPPHLWEVFENVVRWGEPTGTAGASLGFTGSKSTQAAVLTIVRVVADIIVREERL